MRLKQGGIHLSPFSSWLSFSLMSMSILSMSTLVFLILRRAEPHLGGGPSQWSGQYRKQGFACTLIYVKPEPDRLITRGGRVPA